MSLAILISAVLIGPQAPSSSEFWRDEYQLVMSATAERARLPPEFAVPRLITMYLNMENSGLPRADQTRMNHSLEGRLVKQLESLVREKRRIDRVSIRGRIQSNSGGGALAAQQLIDVIVNTISPESWRQNGGNGSIMYFPYNPALVVRQSSETHEQVSALLRALAN